VGEPSLHERWQPCAALILALLATIVLSRSVSFVSQHASMAAMRPAAAAVEPAAAVEAAAGVQRAP
jgi:hypothetical protein